LGACIQSAQLNLSLIDQKLRYKILALIHLNFDFISLEVRTNYQQAAEEALRLVADRYEAILPRNIRLHGDYEAILPRNIRLHGDCHPGNLLWRDDAPHFVDLDDCRMGPAVQDLWMLLSGTSDEMSSQFRHILEGYEMFFEFDPAELALIYFITVLG